MIVQQFLHFMETAPSDRRALAVRSLARAYLYSDIDDTTRAEMEAAMTVVMDDSAAEVRRALADTLSPALEAPRHIMLAFIADVTETAVLVLSRSPVFLDSELVDIAAGAEDALQMAIASRPRLSNAVSAAIAEVGERDTCLRLLQNRGAAVARISQRRMAERFGDDPEIREALLQKPDLASDVRQMLVLRLSDALGELVVHKSWVSEDRARNLTREARERATVAIAAETETEELTALVEHLRVTGQLTTALLLRAICAGNVAMFETALSVLAHVPEERVTSLIRSGRKQAFRAIYDKADLPAMAFDAFDVALDTCREIAERGGPRDRYRFTLHLVESVIARYREITDGEVNELTGMLRRFAADQAREAARDYARTAMVA
ncbi:MAG: DUF2336 domain-containing protein [Bauldia sp.]|uniref:DUF2336 domain-containing protein n=1 Tax=Bauldia sp. TaxID=2575872 RepID=UPI001E1972EE|nr:DUF2336 domain-containing protein [Bauldia sp.]MCB1494950.1 DUF2336 domain-containing protein [Bauldia sp.]